MNNLRKLTKLAILILFVLPLHANYIIAQDFSQVSERAIIKDEARVRLELTQQTQDPATGIIRFNLKIISKVNTDRARLVWRLNGQSNFVDKQKTSVAFNLKENQSYTTFIEVIPVVFKPTSKEIIWKASELFAQIDVILVDGHIQATARQNFATRFDGTALPITESYQQALNNYNNTQLFMKFLTIVGILVLILFAYKFIKKWASIDEKEVFEKTGHITWNLPGILTKIFNRKAASSTEEYEY